MSAEVTTNEVFTLHRGNTPLLVSIPHTGTALPDDVKDRYVPRALAVEDTDWHLDRLYAFTADLGASLLVPRFARYVVDLNRPPENTPMYPGLNNTELCPTRFFSGETLCEPPDDAEVARRVATYWRPYHDAIEAELARLRAAHGHAVLLDGHSIEAELPWLFEGRLPDLNLGTAAGASCSPALQSRLEAVLAAQDDYDWVANGRFKGGYITRHYGEPANGIDAVQLEISQRNYMDEDSFAYDASKASVLQSVIRNLLLATLSS